MEKNYFMNDMAKFCSLKGACQKWNLWKYAVIYSFPLGLSWEYTCPSEANVALKLLAGESLVAEVTGVESVDTPSQWIPATLASQEDLLSANQSTPSLSSHRGYVH